MHKTTLLTVVGALILTGCCIKIVQKQGPTCCGCPAGSQGQGTQGAGPSIGPVLEFALAAGTNNLPGGVPTNSCPDPYFSSARMTNTSTGSIWFTAPPGTSQGTVTDTSNANNALGPNYSSDVLVIQR